MSDLILRWKQIALNLNIFAALNIEKIIDQKSAFTQIQKL